MRRQRAGRIVFVSAIGALLNTAYLGAYCASKHAIDCLAATLDIELRPFGIRVSSVLPSAFNTGVGANLRLAFGKGTEYESATRRYYEGLRGRIESGPRDLSPVVDAVIEAATTEHPRLRYLVAPHLAAVLGPVVAELEKLHEREVALTPSGGGNAPAG
jgi:NAD(P)-dependent dehydrogenase (short-subunit alcohol dehydrogenase family)